MDMDDGDSLGWWAAVRRLALITQPPEEWTCEKPREGNCNVCHCWLMFPSEPRTLRQGMCESCSAEIPFGQLIGEVGKKPETGEEKKANGK